MARTWGRILTGMEEKLEEIAARGEGDKVVTIPQSLDALAKDIRETTNAIVTTEAEHDKLCQQLARQQQRMVDAMKQLGIRAEVVHVVPEVKGHVD